MSIHVALNHVMHYRYDRPVVLGPQVIRLRPAPHCRTRILSYSLKIEPAEHFINWQQDPQSNYLARVVFPKPTRELRIEVDLVAEMAVLNPFDFFLEAYAQQFPFRYEPMEERELAPFCITGPATPLLTQYLAGISREPQATIDFLVELNRRLAAEVKYVIRMEPGVQPPEETLEKRSGSCRDSAELLVQMLRHLGLAARFVSGYLIQLVAGREAARWARRARARISPTCMPGAKSICPAPDGSVSIRPRACSPARATFRSRAPRSRNQRRRSPAIVEACETTFEYADEGRAHLGGAAGHEAVYRRPNGRPSMPLGKRMDAASRGRRCASDHGRRAHVRVERGFARARMEHRGARREQAHARRAAVLNG